MVWYRGVAALVTGDHEGAALAFDAIYDAFPGEIAPKLALGLCAEVLGQLDNAAEYYRLVWSTDPSHVSAAFGLARVRLATGDRRGAVRTLESVPESSIHYTAARVAAVRARLRGRTRPAGNLSLLDDLSPAAGQVEALESYGLDPARREQLAAEVLGCALDWVLSGGQGSVPLPLPAPPGRGRRNAAGEGHCSAAGWTSGTCASDWSARTARWPGWRGAVRRGSTWWNVPTVTAPGRGCS
ncbi:hypothetical protein SHIRM173S_12091 [Streptomyces hirsutus]